MIWWIDYFPQSLDRIQAVVSENPELRDDGWVDEGCPQRQAELKVQARVTRSSPKRFTTTGEDVADAFD